MVDGQESVELAALLMQIWETVLLHHSSPVVAGTERHRRADLHEIFGCRGYYTLGLHQRISKCPHWRHG